MFGSGSIMTNGFSGFFGSGVKNPLPSHHAYRSASTAAGRKFFSARSSADAGGPAMSRTSFFRANKNAASSKDERRRGTTLASHGRAVPHSRSNGRTRSGSRATFRTSHAAPLHQWGAFSIAVRPVLLPVAAGS